MAVQARFCTEPDIHSRHQESLYRLSQEAIHNIVKHAHATQVSLLLDCSKDQISLEVADNGVGFDPQTAYPGHLGLQSMRERLAGCQGRMQIVSAPGQGTKIQFVIPLSNP
jgi:signal transduction histidine kinase